MLQNIIFIIIAYLLGSLSSALIVCKIMQLPDPRQFGSGNPGASNVLRMGHRKAAIFTLICDALKGAVAIWIAKIFHVSGFGVGLAAIAVVIGHVFPVFFHFKGGKGVATSFGVLIGLSLPLAFLVGLTWFVVAYAFRYSSLAAICAAFSALFFGLWFAPYYIFSIFLITLIVLMRHYKNIYRLFKGQEDKIKFNNS